MIIQYPYKQANSALHLQFNQQSSIFRFELLYQTSRQGIDIEREK